MQFRTKHAPMLRSCTKGTRHIMHPAPPPRSRLRIHMQKQILQGSSRRKFELGQDTEPSIPAQSPAPPNPSTKPSPAQRPAAQRQIQSTASKKETRSTLQNEGTKNHATGERAWTRRIMRRPPPSPPQSAANPRPKMDFARAKKKTQGRPLQKMQAQPSHPAPAPVFLVASAPSPSPSPASPSPASPTAQPTPISPASSPPPDSKYGSKNKRFGQNLLAPKPLTISINQRLSWAALQETGLK